MYRNKKKHLTGYWSPLRIQVARVIEQYPYKHGRRQPHINTGENFREALLSAQLGTSQSTIGFVSNALAEGAIIPTDEEFAAAEAANIDLPLDPKRAPVLWQPADTPVANAPVAEISRLDMKKDVDQIIENQEKPKVAPVLKEADQVLKNIQEAAPAAAPPAPPSAAPPPAPPPTPLIEAKNNGDKPVAEQIKKEATKPEGKPEDSKKMIVGGGLFESVHKVKLTLGTLIWYFYNMNIYGYEGTLDDFLNWCVADSVKTRGLSLDFVEHPLELIGEGMKYQIQEGGSDVARK